MSQQRSFYDDPVLYDRVSAPPAAKADAAGVAIELVAADMRRFALGRRWRASPTTSWERSTSRRR